MMASDRHSLRNHSTSASGRMPLGCTSESSELASESSSSESSELAEEGSSTSLTASRSCGSSESEMTPVCCCLCSCSTLSSSGHSSSPGGGTACLGSREPLAISSCTHGTGHGRCVCIAKYIPLVALRGRSIRSRGACSGTSDSVARWPTSGWFCIDGRDRAPCLRQLCVR